MVVTGNRNPSKLDDYHLADRPRMDKARMSSDIQVRAALLMLTLSGVPNSELDDEDPKTIAAAFSMTRFGRELAISLFEIADITVEQMVSVEKQPGQKRGG